MVWYGDIRGWYGIDTDQRRTQDLGEGGGTLVGGTPNTHS